jgi:DNA double-strand break repair nuclease NurA
MPGMLVETLEYAVNNREEILSTIKFEEHESVIKRAKERWASFEPVPPGETKLVGIDSSWNSIPYQGFYIYAVDAVSMLGDGRTLIPPLFDVGLSTLTVKSGEEYVSSPELALESMGMEYEFEQAKACLGKADFTLVDGSILARYYDRKRQKESSFYETARELMSSEGLLYISKKSYSNLTLRGALGDMFYYNRISTGPGFSSPLVDRSGVTVSYVRLAKDSPCIKLEIPGKADSVEVRRLMGLLKGDSVDGYPYVLRLAHEKGKVSHEEMKSLANLLGLEVELGGRQVLGE